MSLALFLIHLSGNARISLNKDPFCYPLMHRYSVYNDIEIHNYERNLK